ncbi:MAG: hypothetical protein ACLTXW_02525 [Christensenellales bacterium]
MLEVIVAREQRMLTALWDAERHAEFAVEDGPRRAEQGIRHAKADEGKINHDKKQGRHQAKSSEKSGCFGILAQSAAFCKQVFWFFTETWGSK